MNIRKIIVQKNYGRSIKQLTTIDYLSEGQMKYIDVKLVKQLNDIAQEVGKKKAKMPSDQCFQSKQSLLKILCFSGLTPKSNLKI